MGEAVAPGRPRPPPLLLIPALFYRSLFFKVRALVFQHGDETLIDYLFAYYVVNYMWSWVCSTRCFCGDKFAWFVFKRGEFVSVSNQLCSAFSVRDNLSSCVFEVRLNFRHAFVIALFQFNAKRLFQLLSINLVEIRLFSIIIFSIRNHT